MKLAGFDVGYSVRPADGFAGAGDAAVARECGGRIILAVVDALGHGPAAHAVAAKAEALLDGITVPEPGEILGQLSEELSGTLGAAAGVAALDPGSGRGRYGGVGNTVARVFGTGERRLMSVDGVLGHRRPIVRCVEFVLEPGELLVMHSDGISSRFQSADYPMLRSEESTAVARELVRRLGKAHDDVVCLAARRIA